MPDSTTFSLRAALTGILLVVVLTSLSAQEISSPWTQETWDRNPQVGTIQEHNGRVFAGTDNAGLFYSDDNGDSWINLRHKLPMRRIYHILNTENTLFAGGPDGVFQSTDAGETWTESPAERGIALREILDMVQFESSYFAVNNTSLYRSQGEDKTWQKVELSGIPNAEYLNNLETLNDNIYVSTNKSLFRMDIPSSTLIEIEAPLDNEIISMLKVVNGQVFFAVTSSGPALYRLNIAANTWENVGDGLPEGVSVFDMLASDGRYFISSSKGLFTSPDALNWQAASNSLDETVYLNATLAQDFLLIGTFGNGVHRYAVNEPQNGFTIVNNNLNSWSPSRVWQTSERLLVTTPALGTRSKTPGTNEAWTNITVDGTEARLFAAEILPFKDEWLMAARYLYSSTDGGRSWQLPQPIEEQEYIQHLLVTNDHIIGMNNMHVIEYAADKSISTHALPTQGVATAISSVLAQGNAIFVGDSRGELYVSHDQGRNWQTIGAGLPRFAIRFMWANADMMFTVTQSGSYHSRDGGLNWTDANSAELGSGNFVRDVTGYKNHVYVLRRDSIFVSDSSFDSWTKLSKDGLPDDVSLTSIEIYEGQVYLATTGDGVFTTSLQEVTSSVETAQLKIHNLQIRPNPAKQNSKLVYTLEQATPVEINVFDLLGNSVLEPIRGYRDAGTLTQEIEAGGLRSGQYILVMRAGKESVSQKFAIVK